MKSHILCIRDRVAAAYRAPIFVANIGAALRALADHVNTPDEGNDVYKHPADFEVFQLGTFDEDTGKFELLESPVSLGCCDSMVRANPTNVAALKKVN